MKKLNILITGHTKGLGKELFKYLAKKHNLIGIARTSDKKKKKNNLDATFQIITL